MFLIGRERRRCFTCQVLRRTPNEEPCDNDMTSHVGAEGGVRLREALANARLKDVFDTILLSSSILYVWIDDWVEVFVNFSRKHIMQLHLH